MNYGTDPCAMLDSDEKKIYPYSPMKSTTPTPRSFPIFITFLLGMLSCFLFNSSLVAQAAPSVDSNHRDVTVYLPHVLELAFASGGKVHQYEDDFSSTIHNIKIDPIKMSTNETIHFSLVTDSTGLQLEHPFFAADNIHFVTYEEMSFHRGKQEVWTPSFQKNIYDRISQNLLLTVDDHYAMPDQDGGYLGSSLAPAPYNDLNLYDSAQVDLSSQDVEGSTSISFDIFLNTGTVGNSAESSLVMVHVKVPVIITKN